MLLRNLLQTYFLFLPCTSQYCKNDSFLLQTWSVRLAHPESQAVWQPCSLSCAYHGEPQSNLTTNVNSTFLVVLTGASGFVPLYIAINSSHQSAQQHSPSQLLVDEDACRSPCLGSWMLGFLHSLALHSPGLSQPQAPAQRSLNPSAGKSLWLLCHDGLALYVLALGLAGNTNRLRKQLFL